MSIDTVKNYEYKIFKPSELMNIFKIILDNIDVGYKGYIISTRVFINDDTFEEQYLSIDEVGSICEIGSNMECISIIITDNNDKYHIIYIQKIKDNLRIGVQAPSMNYLKIIVENIEKQLSLEIKVNSKINNDYT